MLDRLKAWLDAREDARRQGATTTTAAAAAADGANAAASSSSHPPTTPGARRAGLRPRGTGGAKAPAAADDAYVLVTVGTTKFEALIKCVSVSISSGSG
jgi:hypothetical protein